MREGNVTAPTAEGPKVWQQHGRQKIRFHFPGGLSPDIKLCSYFNWLRAMRGCVLRESRWQVKAIGLLRCAN
jgi:hypothetical protein